MKTKLTRRSFLSKLLQATAVGTLGGAAKSEPVRAEPPKPLYPLQYTDHEGGHFKIWRRGAIAKSDLAKRSPTTVVIKGIRVHSLRFKPGTVGHIYARFYSDGFDVFARWDCINGWTDSVPETRDQQESLLRRLEKLQKHHATTKKFRRVTG